MNLRTPSDGPFETEPARDRPAAVARGLLACQVSAAAGLALALAFFLGAVVLSGPTGASTGTAAFSAGLLPAPTLLLLLAFLARRGGRGPQVGAVIAAWVGALFAGLIGLYFLARLGLGSGYSAESIGLMIALSGAGLVSCGFGAVGGVLLCLKPSRQWFATRRPSPK